MTTKQIDRTTNTANGIRNYLGMRIGLLILAIGLALTGIGYHMLSEYTEDVFKRNVSAISRDVMRETGDSLFKQVVPPVQALSQGVLPAAGNLTERLALLPVLHTLLNSSPILYGLFIGYDNGDFFMVSHLHTDRARQAFSAPPLARVVVVSIENGPEGQRIDNMYYDSDLNLLSTQKDNWIPGFDPRVLPWYIKGMAGTGMIRTVPMLLNKIHQPATIIAQKTRSGNSVIGASILLNDLSAMMQRELPTPGSHLAIFRSDGTAIASDQTLTMEENGALRLRNIGDFPVPIRAGVERYLADKRSNGGHVDHEGRRWLLFIKEFKPAPEEEVTNFMVLAIPRREVLFNVRRFLRYAALIMAGFILVATPLIMAITRRISQPLRLMRARVLSPHGNGAGEDEDEDEEVHSGMAEIDALAQGISGMREYLQKILAVIRSIGSERDISKLVRHVFRETIAMSGADGGGMMLVDNKGDFQKEGYYYWLGGEVMAAQVPEKASAAYPLVQKLIKRTLEESHCLSYAIHRDTPGARVVALEPGFADPGVIRLDIGCIALRDREGEPLGLVFFYQKVFAEETAFSPGQMAFWESLAAAIAVVIETQNLMKGQYDLRDALIHILSSAIDAKSPYTGGHCSRVPAIFQMLLQAACDAREGPFADFQLGEAKWEEARLAAWLHDCGKVTTPEYVMDKATKLETLYDRIHEIRTRFEVLKRDAEIASLEAVLAGANPAAERTGLEAELRALDKDFAFVASCNSGDRVMDAATLERLAAVGRREWIRTLDKRLGVSRGELARMNMANVPLPPARERLLADDPEHIIARGPKDMLPPDNPWGFKLATPKHLYNRGELYNLSIPRGTLTPEERYKINDHITQSIIMLKRLPLPKELADMPEIAGSHHETMDGRGYPRGLTREQMGWPARIMAVADIFEALTAWDRPYKTSKTLTEALKIMEQMKANHHIDPDVFDLFLKSGIPQRYAEQYLQPEQNDLPDRERQANA